MMMMTMMTMMMMFKSLSVKSILQRLLMGKKTLCDSSIKCNFQFIFIYILHFKGKVMKTYFNNTYFLFFRTPYAPPVNWNFKSGAAAASAKDRTASGKDGKGIDVEAVGTVNGVSIHEFDLDSVDDKPWRKPGRKIMSIIISIIIF